MTERSPELSRIARAGVVRLIVGLVLIGCGLAWSADTLIWPEAWWFLGLFTLEALVGSWWLWRVNPEIYEARRRFGTGTRPWDYLFFGLIVVGFIAVLHVAGFDHRLGWSFPPLAVVVAGNMIVLTGFAVITWAQAANRHFEPSVRIQSDRGHRVVDSGPYAHIRHPGYVGGSLVVLGMALALGSLWALLPAAALTLTLAVRTLFEEQALRTGLPGYEAYAGRVKYRWLPAIW